MRPNNLTIAVTVQEWEKKWLMSFNADKCKVLRISNKRKHIMGTTPYSIHGTALRPVDQAKYLGVTLHRNLSWKPHIHNICKKSNNTLGSLRRNLRKCPSSIKEQAYKTYVRPTLEIYASSVWDPHTKDLISHIEMVQRRAARFVKADYSQQSSVALMLQSLQWQPLQERRAHIKVIMLYRIINGLVAIPAAPPFLYPHQTWPEATTNNSDNNTAEFLLFNTVSSQVWSAYGMLYLPQWCRLRLLRPSGATWHHSLSANHYMGSFFYSHRSLFYFKALITVSCSRSRTFLAPKYDNTHSEGHFCKREQNPVLTRIGVMCFGWHRQSWAIFIFWWFDDNYTLWTQV